MLYSTCFHKTAREKSTLLLSFTSFCSTQSKLYWQHRCHHNFAVFSPSREVHKRYNWKKKNQEVTDFFVMVTGENFSPYGTIWGIMRAWEAGNLLLWHLWVAWSHALEVECSHWLVSKPSRASVMILLPGKYILQKSASSRVKRILPISVVCGLPWQSYPTKGDSLALISLISQNLI